MNLHVVLIIIIAFHLFREQQQSSCMHKTSLKVWLPVYAGLSELLWVDPSTGYTAIKRPSIVSQGWQADKNPSECLFSNWLTIELISVPTDNIHSCMSWNIFFRSRYFKVKVVLQIDYTSVDLEYLIHSTLICFD